MKKKLVSVLIAASMIATMTTGCGGKAEETSGQESTAQDTAKEETKEEAEADTPASSDEQITLKVFSNLPDRKNGQGLVEQTIIDEYMSENPNVKIEVEALDEEAYKTKFKAYSMEGMPDVVSISFRYSL